MITAKCPSCQSALKGPERLIGKNVQCPKCQTVFAFSNSESTTGSPPTTPKPAPKAVPKASERTKTRVKASSPKARPAPANGKKKKNLVMLGSIGTAVIAIAILLFIFLPKMFGGSSSAVIRQYASNNTFAVASIDLQNIIKSDLYKQLGLEELVSGVMKSAPTTLKPEDFSTVVVLQNKPQPGGSTRAPMVVISLTRDIPLKEMLAPNMTEMVKEYKGAQYVDLGMGRTLAKTENATVCMLPDGGPEAMKKLISRLKAGMTEEIDDSLQSAIDQVSGEASFVAMYVPDSLKSQMTSAPPAVASIKNAGLGFTISSDVKLKATATFPEDKDAKSAVDMVDGFQMMGVAMIRGMAGNAKDADVKSVLTAVAKTLDAVKIKRDGNRAVASATIAGSDIALVKNKFAKVMPLIMGSGGSPTTQPGPGGNPLEAIMKLFGS
jgi:hypothetical protein